MGKSKSIAYQGEPGAYSHEACRIARRSWKARPYPTFEDAVEAARSGDTECAMLPVENSIYGRVADIHRLLPESGLKIVDEVFVPIHINVLAIPGTPFTEIKKVLSHMVLLGQCRSFFGLHGIEAVPSADTAGSAKYVAETGDPTIAALASELAAKTYGLEVVKHNIEDSEFNRTRFLVMARKADWSRRGDDMLTSLVFRVRNIPAALYKALGGFATNGVNIVKLESSMVGGSFTNAQFFADFEGHPEDRHVELTLDELRFFTDYVRILGVYEASPERKGG